MGRLKYYLDEVEKAIFHGDERTCESIFFLIGDVKCAFPEVEKMKIQEVAYSFEFIFCFLDELKW
jgi:hypothetical protein